MFLIGVLMAFLAATMEDLAGVITKLLSVGASTATQGRIVRYPQVHIANVILQLILAITHVLRFLIISMISSI